MTAAIAVLQARTGSRRLPGKALLNFHGLPMVALAALRARNRGGRVVLATSDHPSDDALAETAGRYDIPVVRGPLNDVLGRFLLAIDGIADSAPVVRLTGDNLLPDGQLIGEVVEELVARRLDYLHTSDPSSGLPYGCSVEVTRAGHLRAAAAGTVATYDREHVTPWIRARYGTAVFTRYAHLGLGHHRVTVDSLDDFLNLHAATPPSSNPVEIGFGAWLDFVAARAQRRRRGSGSMVLGTAQLGMSYGIARKHSPNASESIDMLKQAVAGGVAWIDTARAYGSSEDIIGKFLSLGWDDRVRIVTKLSPLAELSAQAPTSEASAQAEISLLRSRLALAGYAPDTVLLHRCGHLHAWKGAVVEKLREWQASGRIRRWGVSVQSPEELADAISFPDVAHVQLPCNILDHRWDEAGARLAALRQHRPITVHVRSALLQGLLGTDRPELWARAHVADSSAVLRWLRDTATELGHPGPVSLALAWARGLSWVDGVVVGIDSAAQLMETMDFFDRPSLTPDQMAKIARVRPKLSEQTLDPSRWNP